MSQQSREPLFGNVVTVTCNTAIDRLLQVSGFVVGGHQRGKILARRPAGKGLNVSRALAELGVPNVATGFVGEEEANAFENSVESQILKMQFLAVAGQTRENITILDPEVSVETHIRTSGFVVSAHDLERLEKKVALLSRPGVLFVFSGSLPGGLSVDRFSKLIDLVTTSGGHVAVDCDGEPLARVIDKRLWLVKVNRQEMAGLYPEIADTEDALISIGRRLTGNLRVLIVTCGGAGGYVFSNDAAFMVQVDIEQSRIVSTVGCGDVLLAAFIAAQKEGRSISESYAYASATATSSATSALPGAFSASDVQDILKSTSVLSIA